jgi:hypothetical protein
MGLKLKKIDSAAIKKVISLAKRTTNLPTYPLTDQQLEQLILESRKSGCISLQDAHNLIRSNLH